MEALLHPAALQPPPRRTPRSPWTRSNPAALGHHPNPQVSLTRQGTTQLQATGKGFGVALTDKQSKPKQQQDVETFRNNSSSDSSEEEELPQAVFDRIVRRVLISVGTPMVSGVGLFYVLGVLKREHVLEVPAWLPFLTILLAFGTSAFGIAYGTLSSSWDPDKKGSFLGWEQAQKNWTELWKDEVDKK